MLSQIFPRPHVAPKIFFYIRTGHNIMEIRTATIDDASAIARVHIDTWKTTYFDTIPQDYLDSLNYEDRTAQWQEWLTNNTDEKVVVAETKDGELIGFAAAGPAKKESLGHDSELYAIYIREEYQQNGVGKKLLVPLIDLLLQAKSTSLIVWVLKSNPARWFYKSIGGEQLESRPHKIGQGEYTIISFSWKDLSELHRKLMAN